MTRTTDYRAEPTLRGMRVCPAPDDDVSAPVIYRWDQVSPMSPASPTRWIVSTADGSPLMKDGRRVRLRTASEWADRIAHRAQKRWLRRAWRDGTLCIDERLRPPVARWLGLLLFMLPLLSAVLLFAVARGFYMAYVMPPRLASDADAAIAYLVAAGYLLLATGIILVGWRELGSAWPVKIRSVRIDSKGIQARLRGGRVVFEAWDGCQDIRVQHNRTAYLIFGHRRRLKLMDVTWRTATALRAINEHLRPATVRSERQIMLYLIGLINLIYAAIFFPLLGDLALLARADGKPVAWWPLLVMWPVIVVAMVAGLRANRFFERRRVCSQRRNRRAKARKDRQRTQEPETTDGSL